MCVKYYQLLATGKVSSSQRFEISFSFPRKSLRDVLVQYHQGVNSSSSVSSSIEVATLSSLGIVGGTAFLLPWFGEDVHNGCSFCDIVIDCKYNAHSRA